MIFIFVLGNTCHVQNTSITIRLVYTSQTRIAFDIITKAVRVVATFFTFGGIVVFIILFFFGNANVVISRFGCSFLLLAG